MEIHFSVYAGRKIKEFGKYNQKEQTPFASIKIIYADMYSINLFLYQYRIIIKPSKGTMYGRTCFEGNRKKRNKSTEGKGDRECLKQPLHCCFSHLQ